MISYKWPNCLGERCWRRSSELHAGSVDALSNRHQYSDPLALRVILVRLRERVLIISSRLLCKSAGVSSTTVAEESVCRDLLQSNGCGAVKIYIGHIRDWSRDWEFTQLAHCAEDNPSAHAGLNADVPEWLMRRGYVQQAVRVKSRNVITHKRRSKGPSRSAATTTTSSGSSQIWSHRSLLVFSLEIVSMHLANSLHMSVTRTQSRST